jgi:uncharacterized protein YukE
MLLMSQPAPENDPATEPADEPAGADHQHPHHHRPRARHAEAPGVGHNAQTLPHGQGGHGHGQAMIQGSHLAQPMVPQAPTGVPMVGTGLPVVDPSQAVAAGPPSIADNPAPPLTVTLPQPVTLRSKMEEVIVPSSGTTVPASPTTRFTQPVVSLQPAVSIQPVVAASPRVFTQPVVSLQPAVSIQPVFALRSQVDQVPAPLMFSQASIDGSTTTLDTQPQTLPDGTVITPLDGGQIQQKSPDGTVTIFGRDQQAISQTNPNGVHLDFLPNKQVLQTEGNVHTLFGPNQKPISTWTGNDPSQASFFSDNGDGTLNLKDPDGTVTTLGEDNKPISSTLPDGTRLDFQKDGTVLQTQGNQHTLFGPDKRPIKTWIGNDPNQASIYQFNGDDSFSVTDPDGTVTTYDRNGTPITTTTTDDQGHQTTITWAVDLPALADGASKTRSLYGSIQDDLNGLMRIFDKVEEAWQSPSASSFVPLRKAFSSAMQDLLKLLDEAATKMQQTHDNIVATESANTKSLTPSGSSSMTMRHKLVG